MPNSGTMGNDTCVTKLGKGIEFVVGKSAEVLEFDKARQKHKQSPSDKFILDKFMKRVAVMEVKISKWRTDVSQIALLTTTLSQHQSY